MRVLVVGCGYVGLPLAVELAGQGHEVFGLRRSLPPGTAFQELGITPLRADVTRPESLAGLPCDFDWVVNCVASGGGTEDDYHRLYFEGMLNLVNWLVTGNLHPPRIVYTSSTGVYGQNDGSIVDESSPTQPTTGTARILVATEQLLLQEGREKDFPVVVLRAAGIYGPGRGYLLKQFLRGEARIEGNGSRILNMIHLEDLIRAIIAALERGRSGEIYNVADDEPVSQKQFFEWLAERLGRPPPAQVSEAEAAPRKRGLTNKRISNRKLRRELGVELAHPTFRSGYEAEIQRLNLTPG